MTPWQIIDIEANPSVLELVPAVNNAAFYQFHRSVPAFLAARKAAFPV